MISIGRYRLTGRRSLHKRLKLFQIPERGIAAEAVSSGEAGGNGTAAYYVNTDV